MLENMEFDAQINFIYHRDVHGNIRKTFAFTPVSKDENGKFNKYLIASVKKCWEDKNDKDNAKTYAIAKLVTYYRLYAGMEDNVRLSKSVKESFAKKGVRIIDFPTLKAMRDKAAKNNIAIEEIRQLAKKVITRKYLYTRYS